ncbi:MAG: paraquat-inducible protein B [Phenylobacterium sp.]|jgi:paraquat-inducible protein B
MEHDYPDPQVKTSTITYTVWALPIIALILAFWLIYQNFVNTGISISITFPDATGIVAKKTTVKFRGMEVGRVRTLTVLQDGSGVLANIEMAKEMSPYLTDKLHFWLVRPNVGFAGVSGLDTLLSGAYIQLKGDEEAKLGNSTRYYKALVTEPPVDIPQGLVVYKLRTSKAAGVNPGSLVYHRNIQVGSVHGVHLSDDHRSVEVTIAVEPKYSSLVKLTSRFWNTSGIKASFDLSGVKIESQGLAAMLIGGIAFSSPTKSAKAEENTSFRLYANVDDARDSLEIVLTFPANADISVGSPIVLDQQQVGSIDSLDWDDKFHHMIGTAKLSMEMTELMKTKTRFWLEKPSLGLDNINVAKLIKGTQIRLSPGDGEVTTEFMVLGEPPYDKWQQQGLHLSAISVDSYGLDQGASIFYKNQVIGEVQWIDFQTQNRQFVIDLLIYPRFGHMVDSNSLFYNLSGVDFDAQLSGVKMNIPSIKQLISGGIGVYLGDKSGSPLKDQQEENAKPLTLYKNVDAALAQLDTGAIRYTLRSKALLSPALNSPIYYQQFAIGRVTEVTLAQDAKWSNIAISIDARYANLVRDNTLFWIKPAVDIKASLHGIEVTAAPLMAMLQGGIQISTMDDSVMDDSAKQNELPAKALTTFTLYPDQAATTQGSPVIELTINKQTTLKVGAPVKYREHMVGEVLTVELLADLTGVRAKVQIKPQYAQHFNRSDSVYWLVQPQTRLSSVKNIANSIFGDSLAVEQGTGATQYQFTVNEANLSYREGLLVNLQAEQLGSLNVGAPILYKQLRIGEVTGVKLSQDSQSIAIEAQVYRAYGHLITAESQFYNASGVKIDAGLFSGVQISTQTIASIMDGGIVLVTNVDAGPVAGGQVFQLHKSAP